VRAARGGFVQAIQAEEIGLAAMSLGAGRARVEDAVDPAAGIVLARKVGERVERGEPLAVLHHAASHREAERAAARVLAAVTVGDERPAPSPLVLGRIEAAP
jgi:pyrimidine-nucleoside phosphorylase/thymidine phosphorylase